MVEGIDGIQQNWEVCARRSLDFEEVELGGEAFVEALVWTGWRKLAGVQGTRT